MPCELIDRCAGPSAVRVGPSIARPQDIHQGTGDNSLAVILPRRSNANAAQHLEYACDLKVAHISAALSG